MTERWNQDMLEATRLTRAGRLAEATAFLQRILRREPASDTAAGADPSNTPAGHASHTIDVVPDKVEVSDPRPSARTERTFETSITGQPAVSKLEETTQPPHRPEALRRFFERIKSVGVDLGIGGEK